MPETSTLSPGETSDTYTFSSVTRPEPEDDMRVHRGWVQLLRFSAVGGLNTVLDLLVLNALLLLRPTGSSWLIALYTAIAYCVGATNSFLLNKNWTFTHRQPTTWRELKRFGLATLLGLSWNSLFTWLASMVAHPFVTNTLAWTDLSKGLAIASGTLLSFLAMRLWVFIH
ncbi:GtrA family protein [Ktedonobacter racemifer DSM 44963]|uniref:GtrA family protein n=2 Tax=Ktedonobacter racemifer TaxID=363277 RepID=D6U4A3_KTERA|nr:GtrA family protein [Ktedonobacter racemifer DSM 44963]